MWVKVTARDIKRAKGQERNAWACPVARALKRTLGRACAWAVVGPNDARAKVRGSWRVWALPLAGSEFVARFDTGLPVEPIALLLRRTA